MPTTPTHCHILDQLNEADDFAAAMLGLDPDHTEIWLTILDALSLAIGEAQRQTFPV